MYKFYCDLNKNKRRNILFHSVNGNPYNVSATYSATMVRDTNWYALYRAPLQTNRNSAVLVNSLQSNDEFATAIDG